MSIEGDRFRAMNLRIKAVTHEIVKKEIEVRELRRTLLRLEREGNEEYLRGDKE